MTGDRSTDLPARAFTDAVAAAVDGGARFCGLFASACPTGTRLWVVLSLRGVLETQSVVVPDGVDRIPSMTPQVPAAAWYEREIHDLFGIEAVGHPRLDPLLLPLPPGAPRPRPGSGKALDPVEIDPAPLPSHLEGEGVFTIPYGPVRSGVFESIEYVVETPGEDIPHLRTRVFYKHRGTEVRFESMDVAEGVVLAERCEGVAAVAHAVAYCGAVEEIAGVEVPPHAALIRVVHAELERVANHLDSVLRHVEGAGQAVALARFGLHKERVMRLRARLCGSRFGRGVVVPGGVGGPLRLGAAETATALDEIEDALLADLRLLMDTPSFVDRLRGTGVIPEELARVQALLGPVGRGSGAAEDVRFSRPYAAYRQLGHGIVEPRLEGDALARHRVRHEEITGAFHLIRQACDSLDGPGDRALRAPLIAEEVSGDAVGWAEAPQGEVLYLVVAEEGRLCRVKPRSASFHNLGVFHAAFPSDILTDFAFIEASFGLSVAGVSG